MSRSKLSKCRRAQCLLCKPWRITGERPMNDQRATVDNVSDLTAEATEYHWHDDQDEWNDDDCAGCGCIVFYSVWPCECCGWQPGASLEGFPCRPDPEVVAFLLKMRGVA